MGEKKGKAIIFIGIIVILLIVLAALGILLIKSNDEKTINANKVQELNDEISNLNSTIDELQEKIDKISDTAKVSNTTSNGQTKWVPYPSNIKETIENWLGYEVDENSVQFKLMEKTLYSLSKKYANSLESPFMEIYDGIFVTGDSTRIIETESNYPRYMYNSNGDNDLSGKYTKKIEYKIAELNELYLLDGNHSLEEKTKNQYNELVINKNYEHYTDVEENLYYKLDKILIMNGNNESEEDFNNNGRAKKAKIIINNEIEYEVQLEDTNEIQIFDMDYTQNTIEKPISVEIEVLESYPGEGNSDAYVSDVQFEIVSNIPQGR